MDKVLAGEMIITLEDILQRKTKKYNVIYADPPWQYEDKMKGHTFAIEYETQSLEWIKGLPVTMLAAKDCALFMWATSPLLEQAFGVIKSWGFEYKTVGFVWNKVSNEGKNISNIGQWTMGNVEICLLATKGKPKRIRKDIKQYVKAVRTKHSRKPTVVRERIVQLMGDVPLIEMFAREAVDGWDSFGNEVPKYVNMRLEV